MIRVRVGRIFVEITFITLSVLGTPFPVVFLERERGKTVIRVHLSHHITASPLSYIYLPTIHPFLIVKKKWADTAWLGN